MGVTRGPYASPLARPVDLSAVWNAGDADIARRFDARYAQALGRLPEGRQVFHGIPFQFGSRSARARWVQLDRPVVIDLVGQAPASHVVVAHFCDSWRDESGERPSGVPVGWVLPIGQPLARYELVLADGSRRVVDIRRRFEIDDGIIGWGALPFAAVGHRSDAPLDWRGPHPEQGGGRYASAGNAGPLTMLPGAWGPAQTGVMDFVPTLDDDATYWLHAIPLPADAELAELRLAPAGEPAPGSGVVVAAVTLFAGTADPLLLGVRRQYVVEGLGAALPEVDLGIAIQSRPLPQTDQTEANRPIGWGRPRINATQGRGARTLIDVAFAPDARLRFGEEMISASELDDPNRLKNGRVSIRALAPRNIRVDVGITSGPGEPVPARVRFVAADGRYLPPLGHREEINPGIYEDSGAGLILGRDTYAYVPGSFQIDLPAGNVEVEVVKGFDHVPVRQAVEIGPASRRIDVALERPIDLRRQGWRTADSHVHFLAPSTALLQAAAEDVDHVHVLATQWGDQATSVTDLSWGAMTDPSGQHLVMVGTENRQVLLGHLALLGARRPILPMAGGGPPEGRIAGAVTELLADWADRCHAEGGLVVAAHFPLPYAEIATDIVTGRIDAVEMQVFAPGLDNPSISEWYRFLNCGYRLPVLGGTDKMSAEVPVGAVRTYARLDPDAPPSYGAWAAAVRAGRTFATSGPVIELSVDGREPGDVISLPASGGRLEARVRVRAAQPVISMVEIVANGRVVAMGDSPEATDDITLSAPLDITSGAWIAARSRSDREVLSAFTTSMASHTSPVYVDVIDHPLFAVDDARAILTVIDGTLSWVERMAAVASPSDRQRMVEVIAAGAAGLRSQIDASTRATAQRRT